jgi:NADP oxidoreductase coenzyme F420-dependent.
VLIVRRTKSINGMKRWGVEWQRDNSGCKRMTWVLANRFQQHATKVLPMSTFIKTVILGAGNVATHLAKALPSCGFGIVQIYSRTLKSAEELASRIGADFTNDLSTLVPHCRPIHLCPHRYGSATSHCRDANTNRTSRTYIWQREYWRL